MDDARTQPSGSRAYGRVCAWGQLWIGSPTADGNQMTMQEYPESTMFTINMVMNAVLCLFLALALLASIFEARLRAQHDEDSRDALSGLTMRSAFAKSAAKLVARAHTENLNVFMIEADIDHFKRINDKWGHSSGDKVIAEFAALIANSTRDTDICGRIGGEEFCLVVSNCSMENAINLADRLRFDAERLFPESAKRHLSVTASFGVAKWRQGETYTKVFERADAALYSAKNAGRNRVCAETDLSRRRTDDANSGEPLGNVISLVR